MVKTPGFMDAPSSSSEPLITAITWISLAAVLALLGLAYGLGQAVLPKRTRRVDQLIFVWLVGASLLWPARLDADAGVATDIRRAYPLVRADARQR